MRNVVRNIYIKYLRNLIKSEIQKQRLKLILWDIFPYYKLFFLKNISFANKLKLLSTCLRGLEYCACPQTL